MVTTRGGTSTSGKSVVAPKKGKRLRREHEASATVRHIGNKGKGTSYKSSSWVRGGPIRKNGKVRHKAVTKKMRKNHYSRTGPGARVAEACFKYKSGDKRRTCGKKLKGARKHVCGGGVHVCGYARRSKKGKRHAVHNYCHS